MFSKSALIKTKKLRKLGKGAFADCYLDDEENLVYSFVKETRFGTDTSREALARWADQTNPHIPKFQMLGDYEGYRGEYGVLYTCPFYYQITRYSQAYQDFKILEKIFFSLPQHAKESGYQYTNRFLDEVYMHEKISSSVYRALWGMSQAISNCGEEYKIEIRKANLKMDEDGNLVLLDMFFPVKIYQKIFNEKAAKVGIKPW